jgi:large subunit ribosomal protein L5
MSTLKSHYNQTVAPELKAKLGRENVFDVPKVTKVTLNVGLSATKDPKFMDVIVDTLRRVTGQAPVKTLARKSIAGFKVRENMVVGAMVTLRGEQMWNFVEKLVHVAFPRVRDFRGIPESAVDNTGNFQYGFREHTAFPEVSTKEIESIHGVQVSITTTAKTHDEGVALFKALGFPFKTDENEK